jgi:glycosyltransferase involved in cell wall biosynthesis
MPTVVAEALAAGAPLVATRTGGIASVIRDGETGWLCREGDPEALAAALARALGSEVAGEMAQRARVAGEAFDWSRVADRYWQVFQGITSG